MDEKELEFYKKVATENRGTVAQVGGSERSQAARHAAIVDAMRFFGSDLRILDLGCGTGTLYKALVAAGHTPKAYIGLEAIQESVDDANASIGHLPGVSISLSNWTPGDPLPEYDVAVICGAFSTTPPEVRQRVFVELANGSTKGIVCSMIRSHPHVKHIENMLPGTPEEFLQHLYVGQWGTAVNSAYLPHDFLVVGVRTSW